jgi:hypothetical protein
VAKPRLPVSRIDLLIPISRPPPCGQRRLLVGARRPEHADLRNDAAASVAGLEELVWSAATVAKWPVRHGWCWCLGARQPNARRLAERTRCPARASKAAAANHVHHTSRALEGARRCGGSQPSLRACLSPPGRKVRRNSRGKAKWGNIGFPVWLSCDARSISRSIW